MKNASLFVVTSALLLFSLQAHADAMGEGLGFDVGPPATQSDAHTRRGPPLSSLSISPPEVVPEPQCASGGQPCAEAAEQANKKAKAEKDDKDKE